MKKLEALSLEKFQESSLKSYELNLYGGSNKTGGGMHGTTVGNVGMLESYDEDVLHDNGATSWEATDLCVTETVEV